MLEKIGLPAKPSMRGSNWVVDASHCQGCSSQFTFINRKHHCRRCGGLFCNSCTQQRMVLRGQGDSPVRICDPCKNLEEAARFEMRHGHKNRSGRGGSKLIPKYEDEVLNQILGTDVKQPSLLERESTTTRVVSDLQRGTSNASCSNFQEEAATQDGKRDILSPEDHSPDEIESSSPEKLHQRALEEKKKYKILKGEGKPEEALVAFKRGKELERQARALEIALRKNHRKNLSSSNLSGVQGTNDDTEESSRKSKISSQSGKGKNDDLASELRELGWSDADLHDAEKKPAKMTLEGELSSLLGEVHKKSVVGMGTGGIDKTQVLAHKKKALMLKREGKLLEAKEELKRAKVLEKQLEEQEFLAEAEDSDEELLSLINSLDDGKEADILMPNEQNAGFDIEHLVGITNDLDSNSEVMDEDMDDPEITAALKSLGWTEDSEHPEVIAPESVPMDRKVLLNEAISLKKEAVYKKRAGNVAEAMTLLRKAKLLERDIENLQSQGNSSIAPNPTNEKQLTPQTAEISLKSMKVDDGMGALKDLNPKLQPKSKLMIQKELLNLKKKALALRREGRLDEADEELRKGKVLECQLEDMESASKVRTGKVNVVGNDLESASKQSALSGTVDPGEEVDEDVTEQDMHDPTLLSLLENLGWKEEDRPKKIGNRSEHTSDYSVVHTSSEVRVVAPKRSKAEIQREILGLKRKALTLRRLGETEEAEEVLRMAKVLEAEMTEVEVPKQEMMSNSARDKDTNHFGYSVLESETTKPPPMKSVGEDVLEPDMHDPAFLSQLNNLGWKEEDVEPLSTVMKHSTHTRRHAADPFVIPFPFETPVVAPRSKAEIQRELLQLKRKALTLRRQGEAEEAEEVLRMAKVLETQMEEMTVPKKELFPDSTRDMEPDGVGSFISQEKLGNMKAVEEVTKIMSEFPAGPKAEVSEISMGFGWNEHNKGNPPGISAIFTPQASQPIEDKTPLIAIVDPSANMGMAEHGGSFPQSGQSVNLMDLLTGDDWQSSQLSVDEVKNEGDSTCVTIDNLYIQQGTLKSPDKETGSKDEILFGKREKTISAIEKIPNHKVNSTSDSDSRNNQTSLQHEVLVHKRKAVSLKREGKLAEAREELRQAKLLEKRIQGYSTQPDAGPIDVSTSNDTSAVQEERLTHPTLKPMTGRDRFKLQQESLAHKRQALKLRRDGRMEEADAEFELAKALEAQLEGSAGNDSLNLRKPVNEAVLMDDLGVEDLLDPQLLSSLKAIGLHDVEIVSQPPERPETAKQKPAKTEDSSQERIQLEERIKAEKVKAITLKRAGKQAEALDALRRSKQFEKKLNSLAS